MPEYTVTIWENPTEPKAPLVRLSQHGPIFLADTAKREAVRLSRENHSPNVVAVITTDEPKRGYPKVYRMGRLHKQ